MARNDAGSGGDEKAQENEQMTDQRQSGHRQTGNEVQQETECQQPPPLPATPLQPPHPASLASKTQQQPPTVHFAPLPAGYPPGPLADPEPPFSPQWHKTKLVLGCLSLVTSTVIIAIGIALGYHDLQYEIGLGSAGVMFGASGTAVCSVSFLAAAQC